MHLLDPEAAAPARRPHRRHWLLLLGLPLASVCLLLLALREHPRTFSTLCTTSDPPPAHPIASLIARAEEQSRSLEANRSSSLAEAYASYLASHAGRLPPRGWDRWYRASVARDVCRIDEFGEMERSLKVWRGMEPSEVRERVGLLDRWGVGGMVSVRGGRVLGWEDLLSLGLSKGKGGAEGNPFRRGFEKMLREVELGWGERLPDVDFIVNGLDEPRVVMDYALRRDLESLADNRQVRPPISESPNFRDIHSPNGPSAYEAIRRACPPDSAARIADVPSDLGTNPHVHHGNTGNFTLLEEEGGFITDHNAERDSWCSQPDLMHLHASYINPVNLHISHGAWPVFSNSKLPGFNDILIPSWFYYDNHVPYHAEEDPMWENKTDKLFWRGSNTGGISHDQTWRGWLRSRFVSLLNQPASSHDLSTLHLPPTSSSSSSPLKLPTSSLNAEYADVAFSSPDQFGSPSSLAAQRAEPSFRFTGRVPFSSNYRAKAVADLDGTAYSGRFLTLMRSRSSVWKSRLYREAVEEGLVAWYHYVPVSVRFTEVHELLGYFFGVKGVKRRLVAEGEGELGDDGMGEASEGHDEQLRTIAERGSRWARRCGKKEDHESYAWLLALEWARILSDERDEMVFEM